LTDDYILQIEAGILLKYWGFYYLMYPIEKMDGDEEYNVEDKDSHSGYKLRAELKRLFFIGENRRKFYFSGELFYTKTDGTVHISHGGGGLLAPPPSKEDFIQKKNVYGINAKFGQQILFKNFLIEWHTGLGLTYNNVRHYDRSYYDFDGFWDNYFYKKGNYFHLNLPVNVKFGYKF
jgi:hypothetical protein